MSPQALQPSPHMVEGLVGLGGVFSSYTICKVTLFMFVFGILMDYFVHVT